MRLLPALARYRFSDIHLPGACSHRHESCVSWSATRSHSRILMEDEPGHLSHSRVGAEGAEGASEWVVAPESASTVSRRPCSACAIMWKRTNTSQAPQVLQSSCFTPGSLPRRDLPPSHVVCRGRVAQTGWDSRQTTPASHFAWPSNLKNLFAASMACTEIAGPNLPIIRWGAPCNVIASKPDLWDATRLLPC